MVLGDGWTEWAAAIFLKRWLSQGIFPLWNPDVGFGVPDWIAYSPISLHILLIHFLPVPLVWNLVKVSNFILSGYLLSLFLWKRYPQIMPVFLGGLVVSIPQLNADMAFASYFLFLLCLFLTDKYTTSSPPSLLTAFLLCISLVVFFASSLPQPVLCGSAFLALYSVFRLHNAKKLNFRTLTLAFVPFLTAFLFFSPQLMRVKELLDLSSRSNVTDKEVFTVLPWDYFFLLWPNFMYNAQDSSLNIIPGRAISALQNFLSPSGNLRFSQFPHFGIFPWLAVISLSLKAKHSRHIKLMLLFVLCSLILPAFNPLIYHFIRHVPIIGSASLSSLFGAVHNIILLLVIGILTCAFIYHIGHESQIQGFHAHRIRNIFVVIACLILFLTTIRFTLYGVFLLDSPALQRFLLDTLRPFFSSGNYHQPSDFYDYRIHQSFQFLKLWSSPENLYFTVPVILNLSSMLLIYLRLKKSLNYSLFCFFCFLILAVDAVTFRPISYYTVGDLAPLQEEADFINKDKTLFRVMALHENSPQAADAGANDLRRIIFRPETHLIYGLAAPECIRSLVVKDYNDYISEMIGASASKGRLVGEFDSIKNTDLLNLANVKYIVTPLTNDPAIFTSEQYELAHQTPRSKIYLNKHAKERAFLLNPGVVHMEQYTPQHVTMTIETDTPNELVLTDQYFSGWKAYLNGQEAEILRHRNTFRKINIPIGQNRVEFSYHPDALRFGIMFPLTGLLLSVFLWRMNTLNDTFQNRKQESG